MKNQAIFTVMAAALLLAGAGCSQTSTPATEDTTPQTNTQETLPDTTNTEIDFPEETGDEGTQTLQEQAAVTIESFAYSPNRLVVKPGQTITVTNRDSVGHTLTSNGGMFDTGIIGQNQSKIITAPTEPGEYPYHCTPHPDMAGTMVVE